MNNGEALRQKRLSKNISFRKLASISGVAPGTIYRIEKNLSKPHEATKRALENAIENAPCQTTTSTKEA